MNKLLHSQLISILVVTVTLCGPFLRKGCISKSTSSTAAVSPLDPVSSRRTGVSGWFGLSFLSLELTDKLENIDRKLSSRFCMAQFLRSPDKDGRQTAIRARHASLYMKYSPPVDTTTKLWLMKINPCKVNQSSYNSHLWLRGIPLV